MARSAILSVRIVGDGKDASRAFNKTERDLSKLGNTAAKEGVQLSRMYDGLDAASGAVLKAASAWTVVRSAIAQTAAVGKGIVPVVGVLTAIPGAMAVGAAAAATYKVATNGVGDALKAAGGDAKKYAEAVKGMPAPMRESVAAMAAVKSEFGGTAAAVQSAAWTGLAGRITAVARGALPQLRAGMVAVAGDGNKMAKGLLDAAAAGTRMGLVQHTFEATHRVMSSLAPAVAPAVTGVLRLVDASTKLIPGFDGAATAAERFNQWTVRITSNGQFEGWFTRGAAVGQQLGSVLTSVGSILLSVTGAAANAGGNGGLGGLAASLQRVAEIVARPEIQTQMTESFTNANRVMGLVLQVVVALAPHLAGLAPYIVGMAAAWRVASTAMIAWRAVGTVAPILTATGGAAMTAGSWVLRMGQSYRSAQVAQSAFSGSAGVVGGSLRKVTDAIGGAIAASGRWVASMARTSAAATVHAGRSAAAWTASSARAAGAWVAAGARTAAVYTMMAARAAASAARAAAVWVATGARSAASMAAAGARVAATYAMIAARAMWAGARMAAAWLIGMGPVGWAIAAIVAVGAAFVVLYRKSETFRNIVNGVWRVVSGGARAAGSAISSGIGGALNYISGLASRVSGAVSGALSRIRGAASSVRGAIGGLMGSGGYVLPAGPGTVPRDGTPFYMTAASMWSDLRGPSIVAPSLSLAGLKLGDTINITVHGALDPNETARQIKRILSRDDARDGSAVWGGRA